MKKITDPAAHAAFGTFIILLTLYTVALTVNSATPITAEVPAEEAIRIALSKGPSTLSQMLTTLAFAAISLLVWRIKK